MSDSCDSPVPGVRDDDLKRVLPVFTQVPLTDVADADRFFREVQRLADDRAAMTWPNEGQGETAMFVLVPRPREVVWTLAQRVTGVKNVVDPRADLLPLFGRLFFLNKDGSRGRCIDLPGDVDATLDWAGAERPRANACRYLVPCVGAPCLTPRRCA